jgi:hypothetical protein
LRVHEKEQGEGHPQSAAHSIDQRRRDEAPRSVVSVPTHPQVAAFYQDLITLNPRPSGVWTAEEVEHSPWATDLGVFEDSVIMSVVWPHAEQGVVLVRELAERHGLVCYDPQQPVVHHPSALRTAVTLALSFCDGSRFDDPDSDTLDQALRRLSLRNWFAGAMIGTCGSAR